MKTFHEVEHAVGVMSAYIGLVQVHRSRVAQTRNEGDYPRGFRLVAQVLSDLQREC